MSGSDILDINVPRVIDTDDCVYCFETMKNKDEGREHSLFICLRCFQSFSEEHWELHQEVVLSETGSTHDLYLRVFKVLKPKQEREEAGTPPLEKKLKLEVKDVNEDDLYDTHWLLGSVEHGELLSSDTPSIPKEWSDKISEILQTKSSSYQDMSNTWTLELKSCPHIQTFDLSNLEKREGGISQSCNDCGLTSNLWLCLHCGNVACGREQVGIEGYSHALKHYESTDGHALAIKLGSLTADAADIYCYSCDEDVKFTHNLQLQDILKFWEVEVPAKSKEKTLVELQVEQSLKWDFQMVDSQGKSLKHLQNGPEYGLGLLNLGNSCYLNSVLQVLLNGGIRNWNLDGLGSFPTDVVYPRTNLHCQLIKIRNAMTLQQSRYPEGIKPTTFKKVIGGSHEEFSSGRQQDSLEFFSYLSDKLDREIFKNTTTNPNDLFRFNIQDKIKCDNCNKVKFMDQVSEVIQLPLRKLDGEQNLIDRLNDYFSGEKIEYRCLTNKKINTASKVPGFSSFPRTLIINPIRIELINWQPSKTSEQVVVPGVRDDALLDMSPFKATGICEGEEVEEEEESDSFQFNELFLGQLEQMGFSRNATKRALFETGNSDPNAATEWLFQHMEDPNLNEAFDPHASSSAKNRVDSEALNSMTAMGLDSKLCRKALILKNGDVNASVEWVFSHMDDDGELPEAEEWKDQSRKSFGIPASSIASAKYKLTAVICHKGNSVHSGHYVAFIKKVVEGKEQWVLYNDEKILLANDEPNFEDIEKNGYMFFFNLEE
ncbi:ubiquitin-specific protease UBP14 [Kluyveromyces lactis]|uniref:Ubiquitin carboxyl-terminal hydrolase n=1 Tax=Kluyveromyces lactis (strain ATCC 8585 / CBS 2359 / DSM 70799 / NBRC 1267 / NRRL Y-1140 / WM37) TaxID=284590 RepID=Q6CJH1_KLULA|nr:uncharacterized protein KLLA0_F18700g [Kluyveromyces lactis]CAG98626.1 KLLA0F18700p [Kluyveromyces lactis]|eukprot:XP_455918.1 uncharacterized protein KLLA0_F18700g [Kluyveromyces lactis]